jgi:hypothetical protein
MNNHNRSVYTHDEQPEQITLQFHYSCCSMYNFYQFQNQPSNAPVTSTFSSEGIIPS